MKQSENREISACVTCGRSSQESQSLLGLCFFVVLFLERCLLLLFLKKKCVVFFSLYFSRTDFHTCNDLFV